MRFFIFFSFLTIFGQLSFSTAQTLNIVAHEDDDILFLSPDLLHDIQADRKVRTVFLTAGDAGQPAKYWEGRQAGSQAAYAQMSDCDNTWTQSDAGIQGKKIPLFTLKENPKISLAFLQLPDGSPTGTGFPSTGNESLEKLWTSKIADIRTVNGSMTYTSGELLETLTGLMKFFQPDRINTQDYDLSCSGPPNDHSDHYTTARYVRNATQSYQANYTLTGYKAYCIATMPSNVFDTDLIAKQFAFYTYARNDSLVCNSLEDCDGKDYGEFLKRQYAITGEPIANARILDGRRTVKPGDRVVLDGTNSRDPKNASLAYQWTQIEGTTVALSNVTANQPSFIAPNNSETLGFTLVVSNRQTSSTPSRIAIITTPLDNIARNATLTASSQNAATSQTANKAADGIITGYPGDAIREWATVGGMAGSWLILDWNSSQKVSAIYLYDRPNVDDQITGGTITFDDGSSIYFEKLDNYGSRCNLTFPERTIRNLTLKITSVSSSTRNVGLAEIEVYGTAASNPRDGSSDLRSQIVLGASKFQ